MTKWGAVLLGLSVLLATYLTLNLLTINSGFGENATIADDVGYGGNFSYKYNLSESEIQDEWVTETCMRLQINSAECDMVYGGTTDGVSEGKIK